MLLYVAGTVNLFVPGIDQDIWHLLVYFVHRLKTKVACQASARCHTGLLMTRTCTTCTKSVVVQL